MKIITDFTTLENSGAKRQEKHIVRHCLQELFELYRINTIKNIGSIYILENEAELANYRTFEMYEPISADNIEFADKIFLSSINTQELFVYVLGCFVREIRADVLEGFMADNLIKFFFGEGVVEQITKQINEKIREKISTDSESVTFAKNALQGLKIARGNLIDSMAKIGYNEALSERLTAIEKQLAENETLIATEESKKTELTVTETQVKAKITELKKAIQNPQHIDKIKLLLREYIEKITVYNNKIELTVKVSFFFALYDGNLADFDYNHTILEDRLLIENSRSRLSNNSRKSSVHRNLLVFGGVGADADKRKTPEAYSLGDFLVPVAGVDRLLRILMACRPKGCAFRYPSAPLWLKNSALHYFS